MDGAYYGVVVDVDRGVLFLRRLTYRRSLVSSYS
jgi:hypothetical protein